MNYSPSHLSLFTIHQTPLLAAGSLFLIVFLESKLVKSRFLTAIYGGPSGKRASRDHI
jgi:hypothetical protein